MLIYPSAFNMTTGPLHWTLLARCRAVDNQAFVAVASPARVTNSNYVAWGHSMIVDPWGKILGEATEEDMDLYIDIGLYLIIITFTLINSLTLDIFQNNLINISIFIFYCL